MLPTSAAPHGAYLIGFFKNVFLFFLLVSMHAWVLAKSMPLLLSLIQNINNKLNEWPERDDTEEGEVSKEA